jgi:hypothetical protein
VRHSFPKFYNGPFGHTYLKTTLLFCFLSLLMLVSSCELRQNINVLFIFLLLIKIQVKLKLLPPANTGTEVITVQVSTEGIFPEK